ncbi:MAG: hypothetical protein HY731_09810, partial [Candidatus Tectomicrobia bacterium]|nr:hypothetical protein [Candidatus Tectomicrobia bacterium]
GCKGCYHTGYLERTGVFEILKVSETIKDMIINEAKEIEIKEAAIKEGMNPLYRVGVKKILEGITTPEEVMREVFL